VVATELDGIVLDFRNLKGSDKEYFEQYIKELAALLHSVNRKLMVYVKQDTDYVDINKIINYVDNIIYVTYLNVSNVPKTAYSIYNIYDIESSLQKLQNIYNVDMSKIILEIPLYSVLWIEKNSIVTAFELYSLRALQNFLKENKVTYNIDKVTGLNYAELNKGSLKYKVWIQDEISIRKNYLLSQKYLLGGIALYKKGYESNYIYNILKGE
jgi:spore germination protein YaaH